MTNAQAGQVGGGRWIIAVLQSILAAPTLVEVLGQLLSVHEDNAEVPLNCSNAVMTIAPTFLVAPKGAAMPTIPDDTLRPAIDKASVHQRSPSPACQPNPADIGPRWIPVPCTMPAAASGGTP